MFSVCRKLMLTVVACCYLKIMKIPKVDGILNMPHLRFQISRVNLSQLCPKGLIAAGLCVAALSCLPMTSVCVPSCGMK